MPRRTSGWSDITVNDQFCGAGGSAIGAVRAGLRVIQAQNHWKLATETYATNHPNTDVDCTDISASDPRRYRSTDFFITSPECTTHSPAGGNRKLLSRRDRAVIDVADRFERSRATMWDVPRFAEYHRYRRILVENVVEVLRWELFDCWLRTMHALGYRHQIVSMNSMFTWPTPQSRDRVYINFWRKGDRAPDLELRPKAPCFKCGVVEAVQTWKNGRTVGKYRFQYVYTCPSCHAVVHPFYYAALNAIDFSIPAERIGDRDRPLKERTLERIRYGLEKYGNRHLVVSTLHGHRLFSRVRETADPMFTMQGSGTTALVAPFIVPMQGGVSRARSLADELPSHLAECGHDWLVSAWSVRAGMHSSHGKNVRGIDEPMATQTTAQDMGFVFNVAGRDSDASLDRPMPTQETREKFALVAPAFIAVLRTNSKAAPLDAPLHTLTTGGGHHLIVTGGAQISMRDAHAMRVAGLDRELMAQGCGPQQALIQNAPFIATIAFQQQSRGTQARPIDDPMATVAGNDRDALVTPMAKINDCYFRMLQPHEIGAAMAFPSSYVVHGNKRDRVKQFGNAVTPPAMEFLLRRHAEALTGERIARD